MQDLGIYLTQPGASHAPVLDGAASFDHFRKPQVNAAICFLCAALRALSASQFHELARDIELWAGRLQHEESTSRPTSVNSVQSQFIPPVSQRKSGTESTSTRNRVSERVDLTSQRPSAANGLGARWRPPSRNNRISLTPKARC